MPVVTKKTPPLASPTCVYNTSANSLEGRPQGRREEMQAFRSAGLFAKALASVNIGDLTGKAEASGPEPAAGAPPEGGPAPSTPAAPDQLPNHPARSAVQEAASCLQQLGAKVPCLFTSIPTPNPSKPSSLAPETTETKAQTAKRQPAPPGARVSATVFSPRPPESPRRGPARRAPALPPEAPRQRGQAGGPERPPRLPRALRPALGARRRRLLLSRAAAPGAGTAVTTARRPPHLQAPVAAAPRSSAPLRLQQPRAAAAAASRLPSASPPSLRLPQQPLPPLPPPPPPLGPAPRHVTAPRDPGGWQAPPPGRPRALARPPRAPHRRGPASRPLTPAGSGPRGAAGLAGLASRSSAAYRQRAEPPSPQTRRPPPLTLTGAPSAHTRTPEQPTGPHTQAPRTCHTRRSRSPRPSGSRLTAWAAVKTAGT
ncbi:hypothetical protein R6Z07F_009244 [Ovis aries]